jgi:hypothetical protein
VWVIQAALPHLRAQGSGHIIQQAYADRLKTWADWQDLSVEAQGNTVTGTQQHT